MESRLKVLAEEEIVQAERSWRDKVESEGSRDAPSTWREAFPVRAKGLSRPDSAVPHSHRRAYRTGRPGCRAGPMALAGLSAGAALACL